MKRKGRIETRLVIGRWIGQGWSLTMVMRRWEGVGWYNDKHDEVSII